jgi:hypothetical protein
MVQVRNQSEVSGVIRGASFSFSVSLRVFVSEKQAQGTAVARRVKPENPIFSHIDTATSL